MGYGLQKLITEKFLSLVCCENCRLSQHELWVLTYKQLTIN